MVVLKHADGIGDHAEKCHKKITNLELESQEIFVLLFKLRDLTELWNKTCKFKGILPISSDSELAIKAQNYYFLLM